MYTLSGREAKSHFPSYGRRPLPKTKNKGHSFYTYPDIALTILIIYLPLVKSEGGGAKVNMVGLTSVVGRKKRDEEEKKVQAKVRWGKSLKPK